MAEMLEGSTSLNLRTASCLFNTDNYGLTLSCVSEALTTIRDSWQRCLKVQPLSTRGQPDVCFIQITTASPSAVYQRPYLQPQGISGRDALST